MEGGDSEFANFTLPTLKAFLEARCHIASGNWAIQAGLLTPLTFAQHCLSPLAAFTSGVYFLHNGKQ